MSDNTMHSSINDNLTFVSGNVKGMGHVIKRGHVFSHLKSLKSDVDDVFTIIKAGLTTLKRYFQHLKRLTEHLYHSQTIMRF